MDEEAVEGREQVGLMYDTLIITIIGVPILLWVALGILLHGKRYEMDSGLGSGSFFGTFAVYRHLAYIIFAVALTFAVVSAEHGWPPAAIVCGAAAIYAILFNFWLAYSYESYLHSKYPKPMDVTTGIRQVGPTNYSASKYALTLTLGFSSLASFVAGVITFLVTLTGR